MTRCARIKILPTAQDSTKPSGGLLCIVASQPCEVNSKRCAVTTDFANRAIALGAVRYGPG